jgi:hypothetical protein
VENYSVLMKIKNLGKSIDQPTELVSAPVINILNIKKLKKKKRS